MAVQKRDIVKAIIFSIITFGIYMLYWMVKLNDETNTLANEPNGTKGTTVLLLTIITCGIYGVYWAYQMGTKIDSIKGAKGQATGNLAILYVILYLFISVAALALMQNEINTLVSTND